MKTLLFALVFAISGAHAQSPTPQQFMPHDQVMDGFVRAQKAPQMGHPVKYEKKSKVFGKKKHKYDKRGKRIKDKKPRKDFGQNMALKRLFGGGSVEPTPAPSVSPAPSANPSASPSPSGSPFNTADGIDLRQFDSSIKNQGTPWCTAYAGVAGIENLLAQKMGLSNVPDLSEGHTFSMYGVYNVDKFAENVPGNKITTADQWCRDCSRGSTTNAKHKLNSIKWIGDGDIEGAKAALDKGHPVYVGLEVASDMASCLASIRPNSKITSGGHAIIFSGYRIDTSDPKIGGGYFFVKNSWSSGCGDKGYQYFPFSLCERMYCYFYDMQSAE